MADRRKEIPTWSLINAKVIEKAVHTDAFARCVREIEGMFKVAPGSLKNVTVHGSEALVFKGFVSVDERFGAQNGPRLCRNPLISCCSTRERLPQERLSKLCTHGLLALLPHCFAEGSLASQ
jgi:hypothetical protein